MLRLLDTIVPDFDDPFNGVGVLWQMLYCPFTPFFILFGKVLTEGDQHPERCREALEAMDHLPRFLGAMSIRVRQSNKLKSIALTFVKHGRAILDQKSSKRHESGTVSMAETSAQRGDASSAPTVGMPARGGRADDPQQVFASLDLTELPSSPFKYFGQAGNRSTPHESQQFWDNGVSTISTDDTSTALNGDNYWQQQTVQMPILPNDLQDAFIDTTFDWFAWDSQM